MLTSDLRIASEKVITKSTEKERIGYLILFNDDYRFFQEGLTKCLIGTRGLLGEGWDASRINVLIDMTTVTTGMSINQLRGRSIRLDSNWKEKVANNWDIVCMLKNSQRL